MFFGFPTHVKLVPQKMCVRSTNISQAGCHHCFRLRVHVCDGLPTFSRVSHLMLYGAGVKTVSCIARGVLVLLSTTRISAATQDLNCVTNIRLLYSLHWARRHSGRPNSGASTARDSTTPGDAHACLVNSARKG